MKFSEMPYERPDLEALKSQQAEFTARLKAAKSYEEARAVFLEQEEASRHLNTLTNLAMIRNSIDTRDEFYDGEVKFWNAASPELEEYYHAWNIAMLESPFRPDFEAEYGGLMFLNTEIQLKTFSPEIVPQLQRENDLTQEYDKLIASAKIPFEGGTYTLAQMGPFQSDADDARRLAAWKAVGQWYKEHQPDLDRIYDELTRLRDEMGRKLGYEGYTTLGYNRMGRNCYSHEDV
ncbi:MAG: M3 family oligoendopeptidase, partial [Oscillospiraceae bacterium]|nr:M3 family oligoendopeptidase [Oscillospiraceae bacterium]